MSDRAQQHEEMAHEARHWVRLTRACNNRCVFCLDELTREGTLVPRREVLDEIVRGRRGGARRLILSGGEPTIHPDFVLFVRAGRRAGYRHIQTVTNGRMLSYAGLLRRCVEAGLGEVTFSVHGADAPQHDELVGVPGAHAQTIKALGLALQTRGLIVSVDICLCAANIEQLPLMLEQLLAMGVREFDLLQVVPFGRAFDGDRAHLAYDLARARPHLQRALQLCRRPDVHVWFNRFPPPFLEGHEQLIQDPHKLHDEVRGRQQELQAWLDGGEPLRCRQPHRCQHCYLRRLCANLEQQQQRLARRAFDVWRVELCGDDHEPCPRPPWPLPGLWVKAPDLACALPLLDAVEATTVVLELARYDHGLRRWLSHLPHPRPSVRVFASTCETLEQLLELDLLGLRSTLEVVAWLSGEIAELLLLRRAREPAMRLPLLARRDHLSAAESRRFDADLPDFFSRLGQPVAAGGVPCCISGRPPPPPPAVLEASMLRPASDGAPRLDLHGCTTNFILHHNLSKSLRCGACALDPGCQGVQLNYIRAHGYGVLRPLAGV